MLNFNPNQNVGLSQFPTYQPAQGPNYALQNFLPATNGPAQMIQVLQQMMQSLSQLSGGWSGALGGQPFGGYPQPGFPQQQYPQQPQYPGQPQVPMYPGQPQFPGYPQPQFPGYPQQQFPHYPNFPQQPQYGTMTTGSPGYPGIPGEIPAYPTDRGDFASYLQAQRLGGALQGETGIAQSDAIPGTRFGEVQNPIAWQSSVARNYAYQFAAQAMGADPLSPGGLEFAAQNFSQMSPDAKLFTQVASIFKGNMLGGPGNYDNPGLKNLLLSKGLGNLANQPGVGETDIQTVGAITAAINSGQISLQEIIQSGTIDNVDRYFNIIDHVTSGQFNKDLQFFDHVQPNQNF